MSASTVLSITAVTSTGTTRALEITARDKSYQIVDEAASTFSVDVELSNNGTDWFAVATEIAEVLANITQHAKLLRFNVTAVTGQIGFHVNLQD